MRRVRDEVEHFQRRHGDQAHDAVVAKLGQADLSRHYRGVLQAAERALRGRDASLQGRLRAWMAGR